MSACARYKRVGIGRGKGFCLHGVPRLNCNAEQLGQDACMAIMKGYPRFFQLFLYCVCVSVGAFAQDMNEQDRQRIQELTWQDHQAMLRMLGIESLRPGPSGDPDAPNAANQNEHLAGPFSELPAPLRFDDGQRVQSPDAWRERRAEIAEHFDREVYGRVPDEIPEVTWELVSTVEQNHGSVAATQFHYIGQVESSSASVSVGAVLDLTLTLPAGVNEPIPVILAFTWGEAIRQRFPEPEPGWKQQVLSMGWGCAELLPTELQADQGAGLQEGIIGLLNHGERRDAEDWGALRAWAWGASRVLDLMETLPAIDAKRVGIEGLSRYGKAALVTMAYDERFAIALVGSSGAGGAKILRRIFGEQVENLASSYAYHWFAPNFIRYAGPLSVDDLPVDAHQLIAMCAPRPVFISVGSPDVEGQWIDARGMFLAAVEASPVYELLGARGLETDVFPPLGTGLLDGELAFRQHEGGHTVYPNWPFFLEYAKRYFEPKASN